eukprot:694545-Prorocentrum_minimum.AAC.1
MPIGRGDGAERGVGVGGDAFGDGRDWSGGTIGGRKESVGGGHGVIESRSRGCGSRDPKPKTIDWASEHHSLVPESGTFPAEGGCSALSRSE